MQAFYALEAFWRFQFLNRGEFVESEDVLQIARKRGRIITFTGMETSVQNVLQL